MEISPGVMIIWQIAASEAALAKQQFIEKEHLFIGLCKVCNILNEEAIKGKEGDKIEELRAELEMLEGIFNELSIERKKLYRRLREIIGKGDYEHPDKVVHRNEECKKLFERAEEIARNYKYPTVQVIHLFLSIIEGTHPLPPPKRGFKEPPPKRGLHPLPPLKREIEEPPLKKGIKEPFLKKGITPPVAYGDTPLKREFAEPGEAILQVLSEFKVKIEAIKEAAVKRLEEGHEKAQKRLYLLDKYGRDLTQLAEKKELSPLIGRRDKLLQVIRTLSRKTKNNPVLIGEAGVGKTAIVEGLAQRIADRNLTSDLQDKRIIELNMAAIVAGTKYRGEFEERLTKIINEAKEHPEIILFIDELHTVVGAGAGGGAMDAANIFKPALARGEMHIIGATTISEYRKYIEKDAALERRFQPIMINEPTVEETLQILEGVKERYEKHHKVGISSSALKAAVELSARYIPDRHLPDKALDVLDEACVRVKVTHLSFNGKKEELPLSGEVTDEIIAQVVSELTGRPVSRPTEEEQAKFVNMERQLNQRIIGQSEAIDKVCQVIKRGMAGLKDPKHPTGVFLFLGPTGVGKTALAKALAEFLFGCEDEIIRLDMSEYMEKHEVAKLIGAPPGYIGYEDEGQLTSKLRQKPYSIVLLDEIEKAHPDVFNLFLQVFDEGRLTDAKGRTIDARWAIFIMTSNIAGDVFQEHQLGFKKVDDSETQTIRTKIGNELRKTFKPEFLSRIDEIIIFNPLTKEELKGILRISINELEGRLKAQGIDMTIEDEAIDFLSSRYYDKERGAREIKRVVKRELENPLAGMILKKQVEDGEGVRVQVKNDKITIINVTRKKTGGEGE